MFEKVHRMDKPLARPTKEKRKGDQIKSYMKSWNYNWNHRNTKDNKRLFWKWATWKKGAISCKQSSETKSWWNTKSELDELLVRGLKQ